MSELLRMDEEYRHWIEELSRRYRAIKIVPQVVAQLQSGLESEIVPQLVEQFSMV